MFNSIYNCNESIRRKKDNSVDLLMELTFVYYRNANLVCLNKCSLQVWTGYTGIQHKKTREATTTIAKTETGKIKMY